MRNKVLDAWEAFLREQLAAQGESMKSARTAARDSPGSNVTRSDQNRFNYSNLALGLERVRAARETALSELVKIRAATFIAGRVRPGSILDITVGIEEKLQTYFLAPHAQGDCFEVEGKNIIAISVESPLGAILLGREVGDGVFFRESEYVIERAY